VLASSGKRAFLINVQKAPPPHTQTPFLGRCKVSQNMIIGGKEARTPRDNEQTEAAFWIVLTGIEK